MPLGILGDILPIPTMPGQRRGAWQPPIILPDAALPRALRREQPYRSMWAPNEYDQRMLQEAAVWQRIVDMGGMDIAVRRTELGVPVYNGDPRLQMPDGGVRYGKVYKLATSAVSGGPPFDGTDTVLGSYAPDIGWDGVGNRFVCKYTGNGFDDFSGNIIWKVKIGVRYARDLGNVENQTGDYNSPFDLPGCYIPIVSGQTVQIIASIPNGSPVNGGYVTAGVFGWFYPRR